MICCTCSEIMVSCVVHVSIETTLICAIAHLVTAVCCNVIKEKNKVKVLGIRVGSCIHIVEHSSLLRVLYIERKLIKTT